MMKRSLRYASLLCLTALAGVVRAQGLDSILAFSIGEIVIREDYARNGKIAGGSIWQPDTSHLSHVPTASAADLLMASPSVFVKQYQPGGLATLALRGTGASHTQVFWRGLPVNSPMLGQTDLSLGQSSVQGSPRLLLGGASLLQGSGGFGGAWLWEAPAPRELGVSLEGGSFQTLRAAAHSTYGRRVVGRTALATTLSENNFSFQNTALAGAPVQTQQHAAQRQAAFSQSVAGIRLGGGNLEMDFYAQAAGRELPPTMLTVDAGESQSDHSLRARVAHSMYTRAGKLTTALAAVGDGMEYRNETAGIVSEAMFLRTQARIDLQGIHRWGKLELRSVGLRWMRDVVEAANLQSAAPANLLSAHADFQLILHHKLILSLLVREEWTEAAWSLPLFFMGGDWQWAEGQHFRLNINHNQRLPSLNDRFWQPGGNPNLRPEDAWGGESTLEGKASIGENHQFSYQATAFAQRVNDWILWLPSQSAYWTPENLARVWVRGAEADLGLQGKAGALGWEIRSGYSYTRAENRIANGPNDASVGKQLIYTPYQLLRASAGLRLHQWRLRGAFAYTGTRYTTRDNTEQLPAFATFDLGFAREFSFKSHRISAEILAQNLGNAQYQVVAWRPMPGRAFSLRINWIFDR